MTKHAPGEEPLQGEEAIIRLLAPLTQGAPGAFGLRDDCALLTPEPGTELVLKTDPVAEGVHFLPDDAPEDIAWKALAVNVSDLAAKAAQPVGYLMALSFPEAPTHAWMSRFAAGLAEAQALLRLPSARRRYRPAAGAADDLDQHHRRGCQGSHGAARHGAQRRGHPRLGHARRRCTRTDVAPPAVACRLRGASPPSEAAHLPGATPAPSRAWRSAAALRAHASAAHGSVRRARQGPWPPVRGERLCGARAPRRRAALGARSQSRGSRSGAHAAHRGRRRRLRGAGGRARSPGSGVPVDGQAGRRGRDADRRDEAGSGVVIEGRDGRPLDLDRPGWDHF